MIAFLDVDASDELSVYLSINRDKVNQIVATISIKALDRDDDYLVHVDSCHNDTTMDITCSEAALLRVVGQFLHRYSVSAIYTYGSSAKSIFLGFGDSDLEDMFIDLQAIVDYHLNATNVSLYDAVYILANPLHYDVSNAIERVNMLMQIHESLKQNFPTPKEFTDAYSKYSAHRKFYNDLQRVIRESDYRVTESTISDMVSHAIKGEAYVPFYEFMAGGDASGGDA